MPEHVSAPRTRGPGLPKRRAIDADDLAAVVLSGMAPMSMRLALLEMAGMTTPMALDKLGVRREHRSRVIAGRTNPGAKPQVSSRTNSGALTPDYPAPISVQNRRSEAWEVTK